MSSCRCSDITRCERDIQDLNNACHSMRACSGQFDSMSGWLSSVLLYSKSCYDTPGMSEICSDVQDSDNDLIDVRNAFLDKIDSKIRELEADLSDMREEDEDYHSDDDDDEIILPDGTIVS